MIITSICMLIAIAASHNLEIHQMDVKTVFLNGDLNEEIYMNTQRVYFSGTREESM